MPETSTRNELISPSTLLIFQVTSEGSEGVGLVLATLLIIQGGIQRCCHQCSPWLQGTLVQAPIPGTQLPPSCLLKMTWESGSPLAGGTGSKGPAGTTPQPSLVLGVPHSSIPQCHCCLLEVPGMAEGRQWHWATVLTLCWPQVVLVPCSSSLSQCPVLGSPSGKAGWCQMPIWMRGSGAKSHRGLAQ